MTKQKLTKLTHEEANEAIRQAERTISFGPGTGNNTQYYLIPETVKDVLEFCMVHGFQNEEYVMVSDQLEKWKLFLPDQLDTKLNKLNGLDVVMTEGSNEGYRLELRTWILLNTPGVGRSYKSITLISGKFWNYQKLQLASAMLSSYIWSKPFTSVYL